MQMPHNVFTARVVAQLPKDTRKQLDALKYTLRVKPKRKVS